MIKEAVIPLAGLGTRMLPMTKVLPKELLPLGKQTILENIIQECLDCGITKIIFIISKKKEIIKDYFRKDNKLEKKIYKNKNLLKSLKNLNKIFPKIKFVYQNHPKGLVNAVLHSKSYINLKHFLLLLPDDIIINKNCSKELIAINKKRKSSVIALRKVSKKEVNRYGIVEFENSKNFKISKMLEKPNLKSAPSRYAIIGRYILSKKIFKYLKKQKSGSLGEIQITDALNDMLKEESFYGCKFLGKYLDCGTSEGYIKSFIEFNKK